MGSRKGSEQTHTATDRRSESSWKGERRERAEGGKLNADQPKGGGEGTLPPKSRSRVAEKSKEGKRRGGKARAGRGGAKAGGKAEGRKRESDGARELCRRKPELDKIGQIGRARIGQI